MEKQDFEYLVNKSINEANKEIKPPFFIFVVNQNGKSIYRSYEYNPRRICVWANGDIITKIDSIN
jgi:hypothetical protein